MSERLNRTIINMLRPLAHAGRNDWCELIPAVQGAINGTYHTSLGDSPDFILSGYDKRMPYDLLQDDNVPPLYTDNCPDLLLRDTRLAWQRVRRIFTKTNESQEKYI